MPNRIIKESICTSEKIAKLKDFEFRLWVGLITQADDAGRGDARPAIIKGRCFPLRDQVTAKNITDALDALATVGLISLYTVGGKLIYWLPSWAKHQRIRDCKPKYPGPEEADNQSAADCRKPPQVAADCGLNPIQSESNPNPNPNPCVSRAKRFIPPTLAEVQAYVTEHHSPVDPQEFIDFYEAKGWMVGRNPMKDWQAACRNAEKWERWAKTADPKEKTPDNSLAEFMRW